MDSIIIWAEYIWKAKDKAKCKGDGLASDDLRLLLCPQSLQRATIQATWESGGLWVKHLYSRAEVIPLQPAASKDRTLWHWTGQPTCSRSAWTSSEGTQDEFIHQRNAWLA